MIDADAIRSTPLFSQLNDAAVGVLARRARVRRFARGNCLWMAGDRPGGLHVVMDGTVRVVRNVGGRQHVVHTERAGGTLGDVPLFDGSAYPATAIAATPVTCLEIPLAALTEAMAQDVRLAARLLARLAGRVRHMIARLDDVSARSVTERLAAYLADRLPRADSGVVALGMTQAELAEELGTVREVLVRAMRTLRASGIIAPAGRARVRIVRPSALRALSRAADR